MTNFDPAINNPPWLNACLREIDYKAHELTFWEIGFMRTVRPRIKLAQRLTDKQIDALRNIHKRLYSPKPIKPTRKERF